MDLTTPSVVKTLLTKYDFTFTKSLGQNFLIHPDVCPKIAELGGADPDCGILEIGPGFGVLTTELCKHARKVAAIEVDQRLFPILAETLKPYHNCSIIPGDVMKLDLPALIRREFPDMPVRICANIPYYITSPIIMHILEQKVPVSSLTIMVQKEAAKRLCASVGSRDSGAATVTVQYYSEPKMLFSVPRTSFMPMPRVDSMVIRLDVRKQPAIHVTDEALFFGLIRAAFSQRRKTLQNAISVAGYPKEAVGQALSAMNKPLFVRGETFSMSDWEAFTAQMSHLV